MKKRAILVSSLVCIIFIILLFNGLKHDISDTYIINEKENYTYEIIIKQYNGKVIISEEYDGLYPIVEVAGKDVLTLTLGRGDCWITRFINVKDGSVSEGFDYMVAYNADKVVYPGFKDGVMKIIVQDIFDKEQYYLEIVREYAPVAVGRYMIIDAEFLDDDALYLKYYKGEEWEEVSEVIDLNNTSDMKYNFGSSQTEELILNERFLYTDIM